MAFSIDREKTSTVTQSDVRTALWAHPAIWPHSVRSRRVRDKARHASRLALLWARKTTRFFEGVSRITDEVLLADCRARRVLFRGAVYMYAYIALLKTLLYTNNPATLPMRSATPSIPPMAL